MNTHPIIMMVETYNPKKQFGFCVSRDGTQRAFFHISTFLDTTLPPIPGELVEVTLLGLSLPPTKEGPSSKAKFVQRLHPPIVAQGRVRSFDSNTGWGFVEGEGGLVYFLHQADIMDTRIPVIGTAVKFCVGSSKGTGGRPRAVAVVLSP